MRVLLFTIALTVGPSLLFTGCAPLPIETVPQICPPKANIDEAIAALNRNRQNIKPLRSRGNLVFQEFDTAGKITTNERLNVNLRFYPPTFLFFRCDSILGEALWLGANEDEFWFRLKPRKLYYWGRNTKSRTCSEQLPLSPDKLMAAFGTISVDTDWTLSERENFDVLTKFDSHSRPLKRIYIDRCDYLPKKIEHFELKDAIITTELDNYTQIRDGVSVPTKIKITRQARGQIHLKADISLHNVRIFEPTDNQLKGKLFRRPSTEGFEDIYKFTKDCEFIRQ